MVNLIVKCSSARPVQVASHQSDRSRAPRLRARRLLATTTTSKNDRRSNSPTGDRAERDHRRRVQPKPLADTKPSADTGRLRCNRIHHAWSDGNRTTIGIDDLGTASRVCYDDRTRSCFSGTGYLIIALAQIKQNLSLDSVHCRCMRPGAHQQARKNTNDQQRRAHRLRRTMYASVKQRRCDQLIPIGAIIDETVWSEDRPWPPKPDPRDGRAGSLTERECGQPCPKGRFGAVPGETTPYGILRSGDGKVGIIRSPCSEAKAPST
jgi:hypothetical protein